MTKLHIALLLPLLLLLLSVSVAAAAEAAQPWKRESLRCLRPFSSLASFAEVSKTPAEQNCDFHFFSAQTAYVSLLCESAPGATGSGGGGDNGEGSIGSCDVVVEAELKVPADVAQRLAKRMGTYEGGDGASAASAVGKRTPPPPRMHSAGAVAFDQDDLWRFDLQLTATQEGTTVRYKGFGGEGYSLCCDGLTTGATNCPWMKQVAGDNDLAEEDADGVEEEAQQRQLLTCPLPLPPSEQSLRRGEGGGAGEDAAIHMSVTKPLPKIVAGPWEARIQYSRKRLEGEREDLGRIIVAFELRPEVLWAGGHVSLVPAGGRDGGDAEGGNAALVVATPEEEEGEEEEDDL